MQRLYLIAAVATWTLAGVLVGLGLSDQDTPLDEYAMGVFLGLVGMTLTEIAFTECIIAKSFRREAERSRALLAAAVARALADELAENGDGNGGSLRNIR